MKKKQNFRENKKERNHPMKTKKRKKQTREKIEVKHSLKSRPFC